MSSNLLPLNEGGLAGHMSHLYEDPDLSFGRIKQVFQDAVEGRLEGTEKLDGQNIFISYSAKDGNARAVRNKGQIRAGGLDAAGLAAAFQGRDTLETAFNEAFESFENVAKSFSPEEMTTIFGEDANIFYNCEIMDPRNANVIQYSVPALVIHEVGHVHIDKETGDISNINVSENVDVLISALERYQDTVGKQKFKVQMNAALTLRKLANNDPAIKSSSDLDAEISKYGMGDNNTIGEYLVTKILQVIEANVPDLPVENKKLLAKRIVGLSGVTTTKVKAGLSADQKKYLQNFIPMGRAADKIITSFKKQAIGPLELIIHEFTIEALKGMESAFILDQDAEVGRLRDLLAKAIATVESELVKQYYPHAMDALGQQLVKLGAAGADNVSTASEGFVFSIDDKVYKFTGNFAPVNQILGMLKYGRGSVAPIERLVQIVDDIEAGKLENVYYMAAVGFKPPHKGHIEMISKAVQKAKSQGAGFSIFTGRKERDEINLEQSLKLLKILLQDQGIEYGNGPGEVRIVPTADSNPTGKAYKDNAANRRAKRVGKPVYTTSPMQPMFNAIAELPDNSAVFIVSSTDDPGRGAIMRSSMQAVRPDIEMFDYTVNITPVIGGEGKLSASDMRKAIADHDFESFVNFIPEESLDKADQIWTKIFGRRGASQISEAKKKGVDSINHDILSSMILVQLNESREFQELTNIEEAEPDWRDPESYVDEDDEDPDSDHWRSILQRSVDGDQEAARIRNAVFDIRKGRREEQNIELGLGEISTVSGGGVEGGGVDIPGKRDVRKKKKKRNTLIREIYNYLVSESIVKEF